MIESSGSQYISRYSEMRYQWRPTVSRLTLFWLYRSHDKSKSAEGSELRVRHSPYNPRVGLLAC